MYRLAKKEELNEKCANTFLFLTDFFMNYTFTCVFLVSCN